MKIELMRPYIILNIYGQYVTPFDGIKNVYTRKGRNNFFPFNR